MKEGWTKAELLLMHYFVEVEPNLSTKELAMRVRIRAPYDDFISRQNREIAEYIERIREYPIHIDYL